MNEYQNYENYANEYVTSIIRNIVDNWTTLIEKTTRRDSVKVSFYFNHEIKIGYDKFLERAEKVISEVVLADAKIKEKIFNEAEAKLREKMNSYGWNMSLEKESIVLKKRQ